MVRMSGSRVVSAVRAINPMAKESSERGVVQRSLAHPPPPLDCHRIRLNHS
jgi:hypothetical protein